MEDLAKLIEDHEDWLIDRVVHYAHELDYTRFTSTLREAWRASICGLSAPLVAALSEMRDSGVPQGRPLMSAVEFGVQEAIKHRSRGIGLAQFLGLLKLYRRTYFDLVEERVADPERQRWLVSLLLEMFDSIELGLVGEWARSTESAELAKLHEKNRLLANEKNKYLTVFESIAEPAILLDTENRPLHMNAAGDRLLLGETAPGASYYGARVDPRLHAIVAEIIEKADTGADAAGRITIDTAQGPRSFNISFQDMQDISRKFAGHVIILNDVTDLLAALEAAQMADRAKSSFLATVSHEIKTPINSIGGLAGLLDDGTLAPPHQRHLDGIRSSLNLLQELTENVLGLSRSEANALHLVQQDFDLCDMVDPLLQMFATSARDRGIVLTPQIAPDVPCGLHGDEQKLRQLLMNLVSNAVKFTPGGRVDLRIGLAEGSSPQAPRLRFEVADTGLGLPQGDIDWLFDAFTQYVHPNLVAPVRGAGLGLAICKRMVTLMGGTIAARPNPGGGSIFTLELGFAPARRAIGSGEMRTGLSVLVVEDDPASAIVAEGFLREIGQKPRVVYSYGAAMRALGEGRFDLVLTDHRLGGATGHDLAQALRRAPDPALRALPIVLVTAAAPVDARGEGGLPEFDLIIEKPFTRSELKRAIRQVIDRAAPPLAAEPDDRPAPASGQEPLLDRHALNRLLTDLGFDRCARVVRSFVDTAPKLRRNMAAGLRSGDLAKTAEAAHQMVSAASFVGLPGVSRAARELHALCATREAKRAREAQARLETLCAQSTAELETFWAEATGDFHADF